MLGCTSAQGAAFDFQTAEYFNQEGLNLINAAEAYSLGYTGAGVRVGVLDSGIDAFHPEFRGGKITGGYDFYSNLPYQSGLGEDYDGHGSHVAGIIGALRDGVGMHGVAFESSLFIVHEDDRQYNYFTHPDPSYLSPRDEWLDKSLAPAWRYMATQNLPIINNSLGFNDCPGVAPPCNVTEYGSAVAAEAAFPLSVAAFRELAAAGTLMVFATGNEKQLHPDFMAGSPHWFPELKNNWLAVTAISETGEAVDYANKCGVAMEWCLTAPGGGEGNPGLGVNSVEDEGGYTRKSGTSMATPHVAGAAALVKQAFPYFGAYHLQQTLLTTATDIGASGVDDVYGWGLLNVGKAVRGPGRFTGLFDVDTLGYESTFSNDIGGAGGLTKRGAGVLRLVGANTYAGPTMVEGGKLVVNGSVTSEVTVRAAGTLGGSGTVAKIDNYGVLAPGNSVGTLTVAGNYTAYPGSVYELEVGPDGATDKLMVGGSADLAGTLRLTGGRFRPNASYQFISATGGVTGGFDTVAHGLAFLTPTLALSSGAAALAIVRNDVPIARYAATLNQKAVSQALDGISSRPPAGMADVYDEVLNAEAGQVPAIMEQLSGQVHAGTESALLNAGGLVTRTLSNRMRANVRAGMAPGKALAQAGGAMPADAMPYPEALPVWAQIVGGRSTLDGDGNAARVRNDTTGLFLGGDAKIGRGWRLGGAFAYTDGRIKLDGPSSSSRVDSYTGALYGSNNWAAGPGSLRFLGGVAYTRHHIDTRRNIEVGGSQTLKAGYHADALQLFTELGYRLQASRNGMLEPYAGLTWQNLRAGAFAETGGQAALNGKRRRSDLTTFTLGLRGKAEFESGRSQVSLSAGLGWRHAMGDVSPSRSLSFAQGDGTLFRTSGAPIAKNAAVAELGAELRVGRKTAVGMGYSGQFGNGNTDSAGTLYLRYRF